MRIYRANRRQIGRGYSYVDELAIGDGKVFYHKVIQTDNQGLETVVTSEVYPSGVLPGDLILNRLRGIEFVRVEADEEVVSWGGERVRRVHPGLRDKEKSADIRDQLDIKSQLDNLLSEVRDTRRNLTKQREEQTEVSRLSDEEKRELMEDRKRQRETQAFERMNAALAEVQKVDYKIDTLDKAIKKGKNRRMAAGVVTVGSVALTAFTSSWFIILVAFFFYYVIVVGASLNKASEKKISLELEKIDLNHKSTEATQRYYDTQ